MVGTLTGVFPPPMMDQAQVRAASIVHSTRVDYNRLSVRMTHMDVKWSVSGVNQDLTTGAVIFVAFLH